MHTKRIIPCLDVKDGKVVKGINFVGLKEVGDPVDLARAYYERVAREIFIPFTVGGGIRSVEDIRNMLLAGADKVSLNSAAVRNKELIREGAKMFGNQCIVLAVDGKRRADGSGWNVYVAGGREDTGLDLLEWVQEGVRLGAGEILLTSMDCDGTKAGYDIALTRTIAENVSIPVIASGGAGEMAHFYDALTEGKADAVLAASLFHYKEMEIGELKKYLHSRGVSVRL